MKLVFDIGANETREFGSQLVNNRLGIAVRITLIIENGGTQLTIEKLPNDLP